MALSQSIIEIKELVCMSKKSRNILWASRHEPLSVQKNHLRCLFGPFELFNYSARYFDIANILELKNYWNCDEIVLNAPDWAFMDLTAEGVHPLRPRGKENGDKSSYTFFGYERVWNAKINSVPIEVPLSLKRILWQSDATLNPSAINKIRQSFGDQSEVFGVNTRPSKVRDIAAFINRKKIEAILCHLPLERFKLLMDRLPNTGFYIYKCERCFNAGYGDATYDILTNNRGYGMNIREFRKVTSVVWNTTFLKLPQNA